jgi:hypothetical protein
MSQSGPPRLAPYQKQCHSINRDKEITVANASAVARLADAVVVTVTSSASASATVFAGA